MAKVGVHSNLDATKKKAKKTNPKSKMASKKTKNCPGGYKGMTIRDIIQLLIKKYPEYSSYMETCKDMIREDILICSLNDARTHINRICQNLGIGFIKTLVVQSAVTSTLSENGIEH